MKQSTRLLKVVCPTGCSSLNEEGTAYVYKARITQLHLDAYGPPVCPGCKKEMATI